MSYSKVTLIFFNYLSGQNTKIVVNIVIVFFFKYFCDFNLKIKTTH